MQAKSPRKSNNTNHLLGSFIGAKYYSGACIEGQNPILFSPGNLNFKGKKGTKWVKFLTKFSVVLLNLQM